MKIVRILAIVLGLTIVGVLIRQVGWEPVRHSLGLLRLGYIPVLIYPIVWMLLNTQGWRCALPLRYSAMSLFYLARVRIAGETFNSLLPSGYVGGEPIKAKLLDKHMALTEAASSVLIAKAAQSVALVIFVGVGLTLGSRQGQGGATQSSTMIALGLLSLGIGIFVVLLSQRSFSRAGRWLQRMTRNQWLLKQEERLASLDDSIGVFYRDGKTRFSQSIFWHLAGWLTGSMEVALIFLLLGQPIPWTSAWFIGAMAQLASVLGLLIPAGVGLYEGGHYLAASMLGLPPAMGLSVSLIRRVREIFWNGLGLYFFWKLSGEKKTEPV